MYLAYFILRLIIRKIGLLIHRLNLDLITMQTTIEQNIEKGLVTMQTTEQNTENGWDNRSLIHDLNLNVVIMQSTE
jgi:hypothetical protein